MLSALGLSPAGLPRVAQAGDPLGALSAAAAAATGLPAGLPVTIGLGDNQAGFIGSVAEREATVLVNVGTGAQVGRFTAQPLSAPEAELRPYPRGGALLVHAGLCGGRSYAALEAFFRAVGHELLGQADPGPLYEAMNRLARTVPPGASDLRCEPYFAGSRSDPDRRASWTGLSELNFTHAHFVRSLLEGMAVSLRAGAAGIDLALGRPATKLVGAGNGLRENPVLAEIVSQAFELPLAVPAHREEAAYGAALSAGVGLGIWPDLAAAGQVIRYVAA